MKTIFLGKAETEFFVRCLGHSQLVSGPCPHLRTNFYKNYKLGKILILCPKKFMLTAKKA
jgi:hypothetical protein